MSQLVDLPPETLCIAIVDDEPRLSSLCSFVLIKNGYEVVYVGKSGEDILRAIVEHRLSKNNLNVVLLDYSLGLGIDGLEIALRIKENIRTAKIIIVTADTSVKSKVLASGFSFIEKPFCLEEFFKMLKEGEKGNLSPEIMGIPMKLSSAANELQ